LPKSQSSNKFKLGLANAREQQLKSALIKLKKFADEAAPNLPKMYGIDFQNLNEGLVEANRALSE
jgi:hypothetical protein